MLKAILVDDELAALQSLGYILRECCPDVQVVATARSGNEALDLVSVHTPDLVFLDIEMPKGNGFDFLEQSPNLDFEVIFVTAYNQYAVRAFKYSAIDYILKPIDIDELTAAVAKVRELRKSRVSSHSRYSALFENLREIIPQKMVIPDSDSFICINLAEVLKVDNHSEQYFFQLKSGEQIRIPQDRTNLDAITDSASFAEVKQGVWLNLAHIKRIERIGLGVAIMTDGISVPLTGNAKEYLINLLTEYNLKNKDDV